MGDRIDVGQKTKLPSVRIENEQQAINFLEELIRDMLQYRAACDIQIPSSNPQMVEEQQRNFWTYLQKQGQVIGGLKALFLSRIISERCYHEMEQKALNTLIPTKVGIIS
jgi:hypothetical protein